MSAPTPTPAVAAPTPNTTGVTGGLPTTPSARVPPHSAARPSHGTAAVFGGFGSSLVPVDASHVDGSASRRPLAESVVAAPRRVTLVMAGEVARTTALQSQHFSDLIVAEPIA